LQAFDIPHDRLINKLYSYNIAEDIIKYIGNWVQCVEINIYFSNRANVVSGIPQGSILEPLLFIIYIMIYRICVIQVHNISCMLIIQTIYKQIFISQAKEILQCDVIVKCKKVSFGRHIESTSHYRINNIKL